MLAAIVLLGALLSWRHTRNAHEWLIMTDELQYLKLADSVGAGSFPRPTLRGEHIDLLSMLYPLLIAPVVALFSAPEGYQLIHLVNALLFASTAVPVYLLTRQVVSARWPAYLAAALAVAVPWASLSAVVMTESAGYPAFAWALLAIQRALVAPSLGRDAVALVAIGMAFFARTQFVFLAGVFPAAVVLHTRRCSRSPAARGDARTQPAAPGARRAAPARRARRRCGARARPADPARRAAEDPARALPEHGLRGRPPARRPRARRPHAPGATSRAGSGILPLALAAGWALASLVRPLDRASHAFATLALLSGGALVYVVTVFGLLHADGPLDRYLFYLAPLLIVGDGGLPRAGAGAPARPRRRRPLDVLAAAELGRVVPRRSDVLRQLAGDGVSPRLPGRRRTGSRGSPGSAA